MFRFARLALTACLAAVVLTQAASAQTIRPASKSAAIHALMLRGDALNRKYHLGAYAPLSPAQLQAIHRRSVAMNRYYGLGTSARPAATGFAWGDAGIGGAAVLGLVLLAAASVVAVARRRQSPMDAV